MSTIETLPGGGTGGGPGGDTTSSSSGEHIIAANQVSLLAQPSPLGLPYKPSNITLLSAGLGFDGTVDVRGSKGVRVTAGPPPGLSTSSMTTNGIEVEASEAGSVTIKRGLLPNDQKIEMTPAGITVNAGGMPVTIESLTEITFKVAGGIAKITLTPEGIEIEALTVKINGLVEAELQGGAATSVKALGECSITAPLTMIG